VVRIADPFQPALLRMLQQVIHAGREAGTCVTLCGEFAADTLATPVLLGLGLREFSVSAPLIPELKHAIAQWSLPEAESLAAESLGLESADAVRKAVDGRRSR
jgi:phosphocarrier protein FPr